MIGYRAPLLPFGLTATEPPPSELPYQGDTAIYDSAGATGSITGGSLFGSDAIYDQSGASGAIASGTQQASDTLYDQSGATGSISGATTLPPEAQR